MADLVTDPDTEVEEILRDSCRRLASGIDLLSRVVHPSPPADLGPISVQESIAFVADIHRAGHTRAELQLTIQPSLPAAAGVERHLEHALLNLLLNATEALQSQEDGVIQIGAGVAGDNIAIVVRDDGPGLPPNLAARPFQSRAPSGKGALLSGVGLLVAREVMRLSGGTLTYAPDAAPGARFVITLPVWRREAAPCPGA